MDLFRFHIEIWLFQKIIISYFSQSPALQIFNFFDGVNQYRESWYIFTIHFLAGHSHGGDHHHHNHGNEHFEMFHIPVGHGHEHHHEEEDHHGIEHLHEGGHHDHGIEHFKMP